MEREILFSAEPVLETAVRPRAGRARAESRWSGGGRRPASRCPCASASATLGLLVVCETERERRFSAEEMELARGLANQASAAVHNARVYRDLEERNVELVARARRERLLNELGLELGASLDPRQVLDSACRRICTILDASGCEIWAQRDDDDGRVPGRVGGRRGRGGLGRAAAPRRGLGRSRAWRSRTGETLVVGSLDDPRLGEEERAIMREWDQRSALATPLRARGRILGTLEITQAGRERVFTAEEVAAAEACARLTASAIDNATLYERQADHAKRLQSLLVAGRAVTSSLVIQDVLAALVRTAATSLGFPEALIFEYDAEADTMTMRSVYQENPTVYEDFDKPYPLSEYPSDRQLLESDDIVVEIDLRPGPARGRARVDGASRRADVSHRPAPVRGRAAGHADTGRDGRRARVLGGGPRVRARVRRAGRHGHAQRPPVRERQGPAPGQPARAQLRAHRQGLLHHRAHRQGGRVRRAARGRARLDPAADPAARGGHVPARHRQDRRRRPRAAQVRRR